jgi:hypothetical protein
MIPAGVVFSRATSCDTVCPQYLLATRMGSVSEVKEVVLTRPGRCKVISENLHAKEVVVGDGELRGRHILCCNPREAERQRKHREQVVKELEEELGKHPDHKATARWAIELLASGRTKRYLTLDKNQCIRLEYRLAHRRRRRLP